MIWNQVLRQKLPKGRDYSNNEALIVQIPAIVVRDKYPDLISSKIQNSYYIRLQFKTDDEEVKKDMKNIVAVNLDV